MFSQKLLINNSSIGKTDKKVLRKIIDLIDEIKETPFQRQGKPEPLKHEYSGYWSRRINHKHRLVYKVTDDAIIIVAYRYHY